MNRPRRPVHGPPRRRPGGPPASGGGPTGPPRRRSPLDFIPGTIDPPFKVLGSGADRQAITAVAQPMEMVVIQGFTRQIEEAFPRFKGRQIEDFWNENPQLIETARKLDEMLASIRDRKK
jgi:hypothetical protein